MVTLSFVHFVYISLVIIIIAIMAMKKDVIIPCLAGLFIMGLVYTKDVVKAFQTVFNAMIVSGSEFWGIILIISLIVAMSSAFKDFNVDNLMLTPIKRFMVNKNVSFFALGLIMMIVSFVIWPSPAVALVGAIIMPAAIKAGLSPLWAAVAMNLFGHGIALSSDYFIQGAPAISAKAAGLDPNDIMSASIPLWITMSVVTIGVAFFMMTREGKTAPVKQTEYKQQAVSEAKPSTKAYITVFTTLAVFAVDIVLMMVFELRGGDATALVGGSVMLLMTLSAILQHGFNTALDKTADYIRDGFNFGIKIFAPIIVIGAFFFLGAEGTAKQIFGDSAHGIFNDIGVALSQSVPLSRIPIVAVQSVIGFLVGLDGSGFSGLPLTGSLSATFAQAIPINQAGLAALGQLITIWVGGGTVIPWAVIPVAAICGVNPVELARKNIIPVACGFLATIIVAMIIL